MCGIVGYVGNPENEQLVNDALHVCLEGLRRLEYRGYDSAGVAEFLAPLLDDAKEG